MELLLPLKHLVGVTVSECSVGWCTLMYFLDGSTLRIYPYHVPTVYIHLTLQYLRHACMKFVSLTKMQCKEILFSMLRGGDTILLITRFNFPLILSNVFGNNERWLQHNGTCIFYKIRWSLVLGVYLLSLSWWWVRYCNMYDALPHLIHWLFC